MPPTALRPDSTSSFHRRGSSFSQLKRAHENLRGDENIFLKTRSIKPSVSSEGKAGAKNISHVLYNSVYCTDKLECPASLIHAYTIDIYSYLFNSNRARGSWQYCGFVICAHMVQSLWTWLLSTKTLLAN